MSQPARTYRDAINAFFGGRSVDVRIQKPEQAQISSHFDIYTNPKKLTPYRSMKADETTSYKLAQFIYAANAALYGLGIVAGQTYVQIYKKVSDVIADAWTTVTNGASASGARSARVFLEYHNWLYGLRNGDSIWAWGDFTGAPTFTEQAAAITYTAGNEAQGIVTSDDLLLIPYGYKIAKKDGAGAGPTVNWTVAALTLPSFLTITDLVEFDSNNVAIITKPTSGAGRSRLYLWDKVSTDINDYIDLGQGSAQLCGLIESDLVVVSTVGGLIRPRLVFRTWAGGKARVRLEVKADDTTLTLYGNHTKVQVGNVLEFGLKIKIDGTTYHQMAAFGRQSDGFPLAFSLAQLVKNDVAITSIEGVGQYDDYIFVAYNNNGSVNRTDDADNYTATATYITQKITGERQGLDLVRQQKRLTMAGVLTETLPANTTVVLSVRTDGGAWAVVRTYTTTSGTGFEAGKLADDTDFGFCLDFQFKVTVLGAAAAAKGEPLAVTYAYQTAGGSVEAP